MAREVNGGQCAGGDDSPPWPHKTFVCAGVVSLIGWNAVLTACGFLDHEVFPGRNWAFLCSIVYGSGVTVGQALMIRGPLPRLAFALRWTASVLSMASAIIGLFVMVVLAKQGVLDTGLCFLVCLVLVVLLSLGCAVFQASAFGLAGAADASLNGAIMTGQGVAGLITGVASLLKPSLVSLGIIVVGTSALILAAQAIYVINLRDHPCIRQLLVRMAEDRLLPSDSGRSSALGGTIPASPRRPRRHIFRDVLVQAAGVFFVFAVTFMIFPGVVTAWPESFGLSQTQFCTLLIGEFQVMDVLGRTLASYFSKPNGKAVIAASVARAAFVPLFIGVQHHWLSSGVLKVLLMALFAFSNGLVSTFGMMLGPQNIVVKEEKETAGHLMSFFLVFGILVGTLLALLTQAA